MDLHRLGIGKDFRQETTPELSAALHRIEDKKVRWMAEFSLRASRREARIKKKVRERNSILVKNSKRQALDTAIFRARSTCHVSAFDIEKFFDWIKVVEDDGSTPLSNPSFVQLIRQTVFSCREPGTKCTNGGNWKKKTENGSLVRDMDTELESYLNRVYGPPQKVRRKTLGLGEDSVEKYWMQLRKKNKKLHRLLYSFSLFANPQEDISEIILKGDKIASLTLSSISRLSDSQIEQFFLRMSYRVREGIAKLGMDVSRFHKYL